MFSGQLRRKENRENDVCLHIVNLYVLILKSYPSAVTDRQTFDSSLHVVYV